MPVPVELLRFFEKMAPGPVQPEYEAREIEDYGDAEVAAAEAAISNVKVPRSAKARSRRSQRSRRVLGNPGDPFGRRP